MTGPKLLLVLLLSGACSCVGYEVARQKEDSPFDMKAYACCEPGWTTRDQVMQRLGPPDRVLTGWDDQDRPFIQYLYFYRKGRSSDVTISAPVQEIQRFNTGVRFFNIFLDSMSGKAPLSDQMDQLESMLPQSYSQNTSPRTPRLSEMQNQLSGRARRLSHIKAQETMPVASRRGPLSEFLPLRLAGEGAGVDRIQLTFDAGGILQMKAFKKGTPDTGFKDQVYESVLQ